MVDRAKKISELPVVTSAVGTDLLCVVANASGNAVTSQITVTKLLTASANLSVTSLRTESTPATANSTGTKGQIQFDTSYVYVCVANNTWKRASLSTW